MDKEHTLSAWSPHSYENIYFLQERYESVVMSRQRGAQIRSIPPLRHKGQLAYESGGAGLRGQGVRRQLTYGQPCVP